MKNRTFIIAEAGVNHNGSLKLAKKLVLAAAQAGADAVKFQTFRAEDLATGKAPKAGYQRKNTPVRESQLKMLRRLELAGKAHRSLKDLCRRLGIEFMSSPFDLHSILFLRQLGLRTFKVPSGEIDNLPYLRLLGSMKKKVILSTGMATMKEIGQALQVLQSAGTPKKNITVLQCHTEYPTDFKDANLKAMNEIGRRFRVRTGYSDHTIGGEAAIAAVSLGAAVIEKHLTLDRNMTGPDHQASLDPRGFGEMVTAIRHVEKALGTGVKQPTAAEKRNRKIARKSLVAAHPIKKGEIFSADNITVKRPGTGLSPMLWDWVLGKKSPRNFRKDEIICL